MAHFTLHFKSFIFCVSMLVSSVRSISMLYEQPIGCDIVPGRESGPPLIRSSSKMWLEGYKAGCTQFLQSYIPDHRDGKSLVIGIAGGSGSGKTTIKDVIVEQLSKENVAVLPHDNYYRHRPDLSDEERDEINFDHPESLETELMCAHLQMLLRGETVDIPVYNFSTHLRETDRTVRIEPRPIILVEGILILHDPTLRSMMNLRVFVDVEADRRLIRRIDRDMVERGRSFVSIVHQYLTTVKPMHDAFVETSKQHANLIIPFGGRNVAAIKVLLESLKTHLRNNYVYTSIASQRNGMNGEDALSTDPPTPPPMYQEPRKSEIVLPGDPAQPGAVLRGGGVGSLGSLGSSGRDEDGGDGGRDGGLNWWG